MQIRHLIVIIKTVINAYNNYENMYTLNKNTSLIQSDVKCIINVIELPVCLCLHRIYVNTLKQTNTGLVSFLTSFEGTLRSNRGVQVDGNTLTSGEGTLLQNEWHANQVFSSVRAFPATTVNDMTCAHT